MSNFSSAGHPLGTPRVYSHLNATYDEEQFDSAKTGRRFTVSSAENVLLMKHLEADPRIITYATIDLSKATDHRIETTLSPFPLLQFEHMCGRFAVLVAGREHLAQKPVADAVQCIEDQMAAIGRWLLVRDPVWLTRDPRRRTIETICDCRFEFISHGDRLALLRELDRTGALDLCDCAEFVTSSRPVEAVLSLAVHNEIDLDINAPLTLHTVVRPSGQ
ncbi:hypothetical protein [Bosea massiliensis]|uniref:Uncharacterized protein n=1 Tax=Bosea massiliensis TaxID=151419 RepID=A0ABW0P2Y7_9HYPH